ncbi:hypothetical protein JW887_06085 [Candidatus Dojkabacteria bacterium]|nr:hypothetical protein [Candidatus Dojkabacteria bacterium]
MQEDIKFEFDIEDALKDHIKKPFPRLKLEDLKTFYNVGFRSLIAKIAILETFIGLLLFIFGIAYGELVPRNVMVITLYVFSSTLLLLIFLIAFKISGGLINLTRDLVYENAHLKHINKRLESEVTALALNTKSHKTLFNANSVIYGLAFDKFKVLANIDPTGTATFNYAFQINATRPGMKSIVRHTHTSYNVFSRNDDLNLPEVDFNLKGNQFITLSPTVLSISDKKVGWEIRAHPEFPKDIRVPYNYKTIFNKKVFSMTLKELEKTKQEYEWVSQRITYPSKIIIIEVVFPVNYTPYDPQFAVWYIEEVHIMNDIEMHRIEEIPNGFVMKRKDNKTVLSLRVEYPIAGFHYAITWKPDLDWESS